MKLYATLSLVVFSLFLNGQTTFQKRFYCDSAAPGEIGTDIQPTSDGGYIIAGIRYNIFPSHTYMIRTDANGDTLWTREYAITGRYEIVRAVEQTRDGGFIVTGGTIDTGPLYEEEAWLLKIDAAGNLQWAKALSGADEEEGHAIQQTADGGYIIAGEATSSSSGSSQALLIKTDSAGNVQWSTRYPAYIANSVLQTTDHGYVFTGGTGGHALLVKTDSSGAVQWERHFGSGALFAEGLCVRKTLDGGYVISGRAEDDLYYNDLFLAKSDSNGMIQWLRNYDGGYGEWGQSVVPTPDGGYAVCGMSENYHSGIRDIFLVRTDAQGYATWAKIYGDANDDDHGMGIALATDGGFMICGYHGLSVHTLALIKTDSLGNSGCNDSTVVIAADPDSLFQDSFAMVAITYPVTAVLVPATTIFQATIIDTDCSLLGINDQQMIRSFSLFPNPAGSAATFHCDKPFAAATVSLYNATGQLVQEMKNVSGNDVLIARKELPDGIYFLRVSEGSSTFATKLIFSGK
jgi:hypothetical protein